MSDVALLGLGDAVYFLKQERDVRDERADAAAIISCLRNYLWRIVHMPIYDDQLNTLVRHSIKGVPHLSGLANFCPNDLPFVVLVVLDGSEKSLTLFEHQHLMHAFLHAGSG